MEQTEKIMQEIFSIKDLYEYRIDIKSLILGNNTCISPEEEDSVYEFTLMIINFGQQMSLTLINLFTGISCEQTENYALHFLEQSMIFSRRQSSEFIIYMQKILYSKQNKGKSITKILICFDEIANMLRQQDELFTIFLSNQKHLKYRDYLMTKIEKSWLQFFQNLYLIMPEKSHKKKDLNLQTQKQLFLIIRKHRYLFYMINYFDLRVIDWELNDILCNVKTRNSTNQQKVFYFLGLVGMTKNKKLIQRSFKDIKKIIKKNKSINSRNNPILGQYLKYCIDVNDKQETKETKDVSLLQLLINQRMYTSSCLFFICFQKHEIIVNLFQDIFQRDDHVWKYFIKQLTTLVQKYFLYEDHTKLEQLCSEQQINIKYLINLVMQDYENIERDLINNLVKTLLDDSKRFNQNKRNTLALVSEKKNVERYLYTFFFASSLSKHEKNILERQKLEISILQKAKYLEYQFNIALSQNKKSKQQKRYKGSFFIASFLLFSLYENKGRFQTFFYHLEPETIQFCTEKSITVINDYIYHEQRQEAHIEINYQDQLNSLYWQLSDFIIYQNMQYRVCYYDIYDEEQVFHAGIDEKGLSLSLIQTCIDEILSYSYVKHDEDGKIYFDFAGLNIEEKDYEPGKIASLIIFITTSTFSVHFPIKEEILFMITSNFKLQDSQILQFSYYLLSSSQQQCLKNMQDLVAQNKMEKDEYDEYYKMIVKNHEKKYINGAIEFLKYLQYSISRTRAQTGGIIFYQRSTIEKFYADPVLDNNVIIDALVLVNQSEEAQENFTQLKNVIENLDKEHIKQFVKIIYGIISGKGKINVFYDENNIIPTWQTCITQITIGKQFNKTKLLLSMDNIQGFHLI